MSQVLSPEMASKSLGMHRCLQECVAGVGAVACMSVGASAVHVTGAVTRDDILFRISLNLHCSTCSSLLIVHTVYPGCFDLEIHPMQ